MAKYDIDVKLLGTDGNAFAILGKVQRALKQAGVPKIDVDRFTSDAIAGDYDATAGDYDHLLRTCMIWVHVT